MGAVAGMRRIALAQFVLLVSLLWAAAMALAEKREEAARGDPALSVKPGSGVSFRDCPDCPEMVVVLAGSFTMGSPPGDEGRFDREGPQRQVTIARPFAVGKFEVTFAEWDACVSAGACAANKNPSDQGWGRGKRPVINVSWDDITTEYLPWLSRKTGKTYLLLTEAEWEYAARGVTSASTPSKPYWWGDKASPEYANYGKDQCCAGHKEGRDRWENTARSANSQPIRSAFMTCTAMSGSGSRIVGMAVMRAHRPMDRRGRRRARKRPVCCAEAPGNDSPQGLRSAHRIRIRPAVRIFNYGSGFRVGRTLNP
jgi:formylglycine-generating enzyme required for sulfatase activity